MGVLFWQLDVVGPAMVVVGMEPELVRGQCCCCRRWYGCR